MCDRALAPPSLYLPSLPLCGCKTRRYPRIVPDYSLLVFLASLVNPPLGAVICLLHHRAQQLFHDGQHKRADVLFYTVIVLGNVVIGVTILASTLLAIYLVSHNIAPPLTRLSPCFLFEASKKMDKTNFTKHIECLVKLRLRQ